MREADRLGLEVSINLCSGWNAGGPWITDETASHHYVQSELAVKGPQNFSGKLPQPPGNAMGYHDVAVQAFRKPDTLRKPVKKVLEKELAIKSGRNTWPTFNDKIRASVEAPLGPSPFAAEVAAINTAAIVDLTERLKPDGTLTWDVPEGEWIIVRTGYTTTGHGSCPFSRRI